MFASLPEVLAAHLCRPLLLKSCGPSRQPEGSCTSDISGALDRILSRRASHPKSNPSRLALVLVRWQAGRVVVLRCAVTIALSL